METHFKNLYTEVNVTTDMVSATFQPKKSSDRPVMIT